MSESTRPTNSPPSTVDPGILEMGASVSVNDELRRNLTAEMVDIDKNCTKLVSDLATEEDRAKEMQKSKHHSDKEQSGLIQCTRELVETSNMNNHIFHELQSKVDNEIIFMSSPQGKGSDTSSDGKNIVTPSDVKFRSPTSVFAIQQINNENEETILSISKELGENIDTIHKFKVESNEMKAATNTINSKVKSELLKVALANAKQQLQLLEDLHKEKEINHHTHKVRCDTIEGQNIALQDKSVAMETVLIAKKNAIVELEENVRKVEAKSVDKICVLSKKTNGLKKEMTLVDDKLTHISTAYCKVGKITKERNEAKDDFDQLRLDRGASFSSKVSHQSDITAMQKKHEGDRRSIYNETNLAETIAELKAENDAMDLNGKKSELDKWIIKGKLHNEYLEAKTFPGKGNLLQSIVQQKKELEQIKDEISHAKKEKASNESLLNEHKRLVDDHREEYENIFQKIETQVAEEKETLLALDRQMKEKIAKNDNYGLLLRRAKLYKYARKLLKQVLVKETKLAEMSNE